jgi:hypothetical protein
MLNKGIPILDTTEWGSVRCPHVTQNVVLFKAHELFLSTYPYNENIIAIEGNHLKKKV